MKIRGRKSKVRDDCVRLFSLSRLLWTCYGGHRLWCRIYIETVRPVSRLRSPTPRRTPRQSTGYRMLSMDVAHRNLRMAATAVIAMTQIWVIVAAERMSRATLCSAVDAAFGCSVFGCIYIM